MLHIKKQRAKVTYRIKTDEDEFEIKTSFMDLDKVLTLTSNPDIIVLRVQKGR